MQLDDLEAGQRKLSTRLATRVVRACLLEAIAPKVGNVHPTAAFADMHFEDFVQSAHALRPVFATLGVKPLGQLMKEAILATRRVTTVNTNLGIVLLLGPLAAARYQEHLGAAGDSRKILKRVLENFTVDDARQIYEAIRIAAPGGLGTVDQMDVNDLAPANIMSAMELAADRDMIAWEYVHQFERTRFLADRLQAVRTGTAENGWFDRVEPTAQRAFSAGLPPSQKDVAADDAATRRQFADWQTAICRVQLEALARWKDSLILRKCGAAQAEEVRQRAQSVMDGRWTLSEYDDYLRADGNRRNPGAIADLLAAAIFWNISQKL